MKELTTLGDEQSTQYYYKKKHDEASSEKIGTGIEELRVETNPEENSEKTSRHGTKIYVEKSNGHDEKKFKLQTNGDADENNYGTLKETIEEIMKKYREKAEADRKAAQADREAAQEDREAAAKAAAEAARADRETFWKMMQLWIQQNQEPAITATTKPETKNDDTATAQPNNETVEDEDEDKNDNRKELPWHANERHRFPRVNLVELLTTSKQEKATTVGEEAEVRNKKAKATSTDENKDRMDRGSDPRDYFGRKERPPSQATKNERKRIRRNCCRWECTPAHKQEDAGIEPRELVGRVENGPPEKEKQEKFSPSK